MLNRQIVKAVANSLNDRYGQSRNQALTALTKLLLRRARGDHHISKDELSALLHTPLESGFPLPYINLQIDGTKNTVSLNNFEFKVPEESEGIVLDWNHHALWRIAVLNEAGQYEMVACSDPYAIPHGELSVPLSEHYSRTAHGAVITDNMIMVNGGITWLIETVEHAALIIAQRGLALPYQFHRIFNQLQSQANMILESSEELSQTFVNGEVLTDLGLPYPEQGMSSVGDLVEQLIAAKAANPEPTPEDEEATKLMLKIQDALNAKAVLAEVLALPAKKRTTKAITDAIVKHLPQF